jgi:putative PEP-CTERM system histidine kinase
VNFTALIGFTSAAAAGGILVGAAVSARRAVARWAFVAGMALLGVESLFSALSAAATATEQVAYWQRWRLIVTSFLPGTWLFFSTSYARGNSWEFLTRWRVLLIANFLAPIGLAVVFRGDLIAAVGSGELDQWAFRLGWPGLALQLIFLLNTILVLMNLERTFRASVGTMRWRIKYVVLGLGVLFAVRAYSSSQYLLFRAANPSLDAVNSGALIVACALILRGLVRAGAFEVSLYPSRSVLHQSLTLLLAGIYLLIVGVLARIVAFLGGDAAFTVKAFVVLVSLVLLTMLLLSDRVRLHTRRFASRYFQRPFYNYRTVWRRFAEGTASRVEQMELCTAVVKLISEVFEVLSVTIWVASGREEKLAFAASSSLSETKDRGLGLTGADAAEVIPALRNCPDPIDLDTAKDKWAETLRRAHPAEFRKGGHRICVPMIARGELLGLIILGDRVGGVAFSTQDADLLKCIADQTAASLLNIQLSQRLMQAREMEAFQTMSAFFVHDLKNTASTLSLMLQNLPAHYNDPAFREDALRGITKAVQHVNDLIRRLTLLRRETAVGLVEADLNESVMKVIATLDWAPEVSLKKELGPLPKQLLDPEQIQKVVTNLVLNAKEALKGGGEIRIQTRRQNGWAVLSVSDNGCGMSREFVERSLFRAFQTTKKNGIGIGMFQSKMIVEAHHGKIEVETAPDHGTTFRVLLPLAPDLK